MSSNVQGIFVIICSIENFTVITNVWITNVCVVNDVQKHGKVEHRRGQRGRQRKHLVPYENVEILSSDQGKYSVWKGL
jgi:hypothetical protein